MVEVRDDDDPPPALREEASVEPTATLAGLESAKGVIQGRLARELRMKRTPHLAFEYDPSVEHGVRMTKLIDELAPDSPTDDGAGDSSAE